MAIQEGIITIKGTVQGFNFYVHDGKVIARRAGGGFNGNSIKTKPEMVRVRENAGEFGKVSKAVKLFRLGLFPFLKDLNDISLHRRLMSLFQAIKAFDTVSERGERTFQNGLLTADGSNLLKAFAITTQKAGSMLPGKGAFDEATQTYTVSNITLQQLRLPKGARGLQVCLGVLVADFAAGTTLFVKSNVMTLDRDFSDTGFVLTPETLPSGNGLRIAVLQVRYYQEVNGEVFLFNALGEQGLEVVGGW